MANADARKRETAQVDMQQASETGYWYVMTVVPITFIALVIALIVMG